MREFFICVPCIFHMSHDYDGQQSSINYNDHGCGWAPVTPDCRTTYIAQSLPTERYCDDADDKGPYGNASYQQVSQWLSLTQSERDAIRRQGGGLHNYNR